MVEQLNVTSDQQQAPAGDTGHFQEAMKEFGLDPDRMIEVTSERVNNLQEMLVEEVRARPLRALGWAAAVGLVIGVMAAR